MDRDSGVITNAKFRMWLRPDGVVQLVWATGTTIVLEDALAAIDAMAQLTAGRRIPLLVDLHDIGPQERAARLEFTRRADLVSAVALIVGTPLSRITVNLFLTVSKPPTPTRLFDDEASAIDWLREFVG